jgi:hypothetical protein
MVLINSSSARYGLACATALLISHEPVRAQRAVDLSFHDLFHVEVHTYEGDVYLNIEPDSLRSDTVNGSICSALWNAHAYLYTNYSELWRQETELLALLPDTAALQRKFDAFLEADTAFQRLYMRSVRRDMVAPLPLDSALRIAAHFYYVHRLEGEVTCHVCIGINKVKTLSASPSHPYHAAFCYMAIAAMDDHFEPFDRTIIPIRDELKGDPTDARLQQLEQFVYDTIARDPELRQALLDEYDRKAQYLNFELIRQADPRWK